MKIFKYGFRSSHSNLYARCEQPVLNIPVYYQDDVVCSVSMNPFGEFYMTLPDDLDTKLRINDLFIDPEWMDLDVAAYSQEISDEKIRISALHLRDLPMYI